MRHTLHPHDLADRLEEKGCEVFLEEQNWFEMKSKESGSVVNGKPDLIALNPDGTATIYDVKTGQARASDEVQVKLYMFFLPLSGHPRPVETPAVELSPVRPTIRCSGCRSS